MDFRNKPFPHRIYLLGVVAGTALTTVLRTLALFFDLDSIGYLDNGALTVLTAVFQVLIAADCILLPFFIKKDTLIKDVTPGRASRSLCYVAAAFLIAAVALLAVRLGNIEQILFAVLALIALLCGTAYLLLCARGLGGAYALTALGLIFGAVLLISLTYFDLYTPMNAPRKTSLHLCLLSAMLYVLYEMRMVLSRPFPRALTALAALCFFLSFSMSGSNLILGFAKGVDPIYTVGDLTALGCGLSALATLLRPLTPTADPDTNSAEKETDAL